MLTLTVSQEKRGASSVKIFRIQSRAANLIATTDFDDLKPADWAQSSDDRRNLGVLEGGPLTVIPKIIGFLLDSVIPTGYSS